MIFFHKTKSTRLRNEILPQFKDMGLPKVVLKKFYK